MIEGKKILVEQIKGTAGKRKEVKRTLSALGLGRIGRKREFVANPALLGMLRRVRHMVVVSEV